VAIPLFLAIAGLAIDGGVLLASRRQLQSVADGAARAGATRLDVARLRDSGGAEVQLDRDQAVSTANAYLARQMAVEATWQTSPRVQVETTGRRVHVVIQTTLQTAFLRIVHIDQVSVEAGAFADVEYGVRGGTGT
jgi:Flp pilus assembly protein TadG